MSDSNLIPLLTSRKEEGQFDWEMYKIFVLEKCPYSLWENGKILLLDRHGRRKLIDSSGRKKNACQINSHGKAQELFVYNTLIKDKKEISHMHYP